MKVDFRKLALDKYFASHSQAFYGSASALSIGAGIVLSDVEFADHNPAQDSYDIVEGNVLVLTHECDIDANNDRFFNEYVLVCPIIDLGEYCEEVRSVEGDTFIPSRITSLARNDVYRVFMLPPDNSGRYPLLQNGGLLYLNQIRGVHINKLAAQGAKKICALSEYGQNLLDHKIANHLRRPKSENLPRLM